MTESSIYLRNFSIFKSAIKIDISTRMFVLLDFEESMIEATGTFSVVAGNVLGVYASLKGPVFFLNEKHEIGRHGEVSATITEMECGVRFELVIEGKLFCSFEYKPDIVLNTNPYDTSPADVDLCYMLASAVESEQFFRNYTKDSFSAWNSELIK